MKLEGIDRREFLKGAAGTLALLLSAKGLSAAEAGSAAAATATPAPAGPPVKIGVVGLGKWGRETVTTLSAMPSAQVTAICDTYEAFVTRAGKVVEKAAKFADYRKLLESPDVEAVIVATPTHMHKEIVLAALQAGKHVYCEAPIAHTVDDAKAIALAAKGSKQVFQAGLQGRSNLLYGHVASFVKAGVLGDVVQLYGQWNKRSSWKSPAPNAEREKETNWRLDKSITTGLVGENGIHQIDLANRYMDAVPVAVSGHGAVLGWKDGRDVPDTVSCVIEYPGGARMQFASTLASSFSNAYTLFQGTNSTLALRENRGWMIKEAEAALVGWEVYATKENQFDEPGAICMIVDASKIHQEKQAGGEGSAESTKDAQSTDAVEPTKEPHYCALESFTKSVRDGSTPASGAVEGYQAAAVAIKANEAIVAGSRIELPKELFELA